MLNKCVMCGYDALEDVMEPITHELDGVKFTRTVPAEKCSHCGEGYYRAEVLQAFDIWIERQLLRMTEPYGPDQKEFLRTRDLAQKKYAEMGSKTPVKAESLYEELWGSEEDDGQP